MRVTLTFLLLLASLSSLDAQEIAWVKTFSQANSANPASNSEQLSVRSDGTYWLATMPQRNSYYPPSSLGDLRIYQMDPSGVILDSVDAYGNGVVQEMSSYDNETFLLIGYSNILSIAGLTFGGNPDFRQLVVHLTGQGQVNILWEQPDSTVALYASGPGELLAVSNEGLTGAHLTRYNTSGTILQNRAIPGLGRAYGISQNTNGQIVISGSCLGNSFQLDTISLPSSSFYNGYVLKLDSNFQGIWGNLIEDITCQKIKHRQEPNGAILLGAGTTQPLTFGNFSHQGPNTSISDFYLTQLDGQGAYQWVQEIPGDTGWSRAQLASELPMDFDNLGNAYMIGTVNSTVHWGGGQYTASASGQTDGFVISFDGAGNLRWVRNLGLGGRVIPSRVEVLGVDSVLISGGASDSALFGSNLVPMEPGDEFITLIVPEVATSLHPISSLDINIYPNPFEDVVLMEGDVAGLEYKIYDLQGKVLLAGTCHEPIETSMLSSGLYFIVINNEFGERVQFNRLTKRSDSNSIR